MGEIQEQNLEWNLGQEQEVGNNWKAVGISSQTALDSLLTRSFMKAISQQVQSALQSKNTRLQKIFLPPLLFSFHRKQEGVVKSSMKQLRREDIKPRLESFSFQISDSVR